MRPPDWTPEEIDRLRELAGQGLSSTEIGADLGKSRNSVIGCARRRGIALLYRQYDDIPPWPQSPQTRTDLRPQKPPPGRKYWRTVLDLEPDLCKFPEGDNHFTFCGAPQAEGGPYCGAHAAIAFNRPGVRAA